MWIWNHPNWPNYSHDASDFTERVEVFYRTAERIARIFEEGRVGFKGGLSAGNYVSIAKCSPATATRDLAELRDMGALVSHGQGRGTRYEISYPQPQPTSAWFYTRRAGHRPRP